MIRNHNFYIDKTGFIKEWWESGGHTTLITRPRWFGKTLNMSMLECCNSSAFGFLLRATPTFKVAYSEVGVAYALFTLSSMTNQQGDWSWAELLRNVSFPTNMREGATCLKVYPSGRKKNTGSCREVIL